MHEHAISPSIDSFIGIRKVCEISGFSKSTVLRKIQAGQAPAPVIEEGNLKRWSLAEWQAWQQARLQERTDRHREPSQPVAA
jgi:predicted DNA-binding transcriptional regulator AlpA